MNGHDIIIPRMGKVRVKIPARKQETFTPACVLWLWG